MGAAVVWLPTDTTTVYVDIYCGETYALNKECNSRENSIQADLTAQLTTNRSHWIVQWIHNMMLDCVKFVIGGSGESRWCEKKIDYRRFVGRRGSPHLCLRLTFIGIYCALKKSKICNPTVWVFSLLCLMAQRYVDSANILDRPNQFQKMPQPVVAV